MNISAIPTMYNGTQFRSRLEARWAAFFDLMRFPWKYEPFDCEGYIPDFLLFDRVLLEVKPIIWGQPKHNEEPGSHDAMQKLERAFPDNRFHWLALVGAGIYLCNGPEHVSTALIGRVATRRIVYKNGEWDQDDKWAWGDLSLNWWRSNNELSLEAQPILGSQWTTEPNLDQLWREAGNRVQWQSPRNGDKAKRNRKAKPRRRYVDLPRFEPKFEHSTPSVPEEAWRSEPVPKDEVRSFFRNFSFEDE